MDPADWDRIKEYFGWALTLTVEERRGYLARLEQKHPTLAAEVCSLVASHEAAGSFLERSDD